MDALPRAKTYDVILCPTTMDIHFKHYKYLRYNIKTLHKSLQVHRERYLQEFSTTHERTNSQMVAFERDTSQVSCEHCPIPKQQASAVISFLQYNIVVTKLKREYIL